jgi:chromosome partitioning protein
MHVAIALMKAGQRVGTIDLDSTQKSLTRYIENRAIWANFRRIELEIPAHRHVARAQGAKLEENEAEELAAFASAAESFEEPNDFLVIDTPASDTYLMRLAHLMADTLLTPLHDSFLDFGSLASIDPITHEIVDAGHYAGMVCEARQRRRLFDRALTDWVVIRNRLSLSRMVGPSVGQLGLRLAFRDIEGCAERPLYRELFPAGLTVLDALDEKVLGKRPTRSHAAAQREMLDLFAQLKLPIDERGRRRAAVRAEWTAADGPLDIQGVLGN